MTTLTDRARPEDIPEDVWEAAIVAEKQRASRELGWPEKDVPVDPEYVEPIARAILAAEKRGAAREREAPTHRHKKRGTEYALIGVGKMQAEGWQRLMNSDGPMWQRVDMHEVAIYRSVDDGSLWVRPREEFEDGRFEAIRNRESDK